MPRRVLVIRPGALGDAILTLPLVDALIRGGAERVSILGTPSAWEFLAPAQRTVSVLDVGATPWLGLFGGTFTRSATAEIAAHDAAVVCLTRPEQAVAALRSAGVRDIVVDDPSRTQHVGHFSDGLLRPAMRHWSVSAGKAPVFLADDPLLAPAAAEQAAARERLGVAANGFVVLHPGSGGDFKRWPAARFAALGERIPTELDCAVVVLVGPADETVSAELAAAWGGRTGVTLAVNWPLRLVLALLSMARAYVGNDSGITHLAARACPTLAIFGPTDPAIWGPLGPKVRVLRAPDGRLDALDVDPVLKALAAFTKN
jgi:heptosyltransferase-2